MAHDLELLGLKQTYPTPERAIAIQLECRASWEEVGEGGSETCMQPAIPPRQLRLEAGGLVHGVRGRKLVLVSLADPAGSLTNFERSLEVAGGSGMSCCPGPRELLGNLGVEGMRGELLFV